MFRVISSWSDQYVKESNSLAKKGIQVDNTLDTRGWKILNLKCQI